MSKFCALSSQFGKKKGKGGQTNIRKSVSRKGVCKTSSNENMNRGGRKPGETSIFKKALWRREKSRAGGRIEQRGHPILNPLQPAGKSGQIA